MEDGKQGPEAIAQLLCDFLLGARSTVEIAIYDLVLEGPARDRLAATLAELNARGVRPRVAYNVDHRAQGHIPPPQMIVVPHDLLQFCEARPVPGQPDLMHHKYAVRDRSAVWTGSTNWTNDSWSREENVIVRIESPGVAAAYLSDFEELWSTLKVEGSGRLRPEWIPLPPAARVRPYFTPYRAPALTSEVAQRLRTARRRIRICSPVLTSGPILGALADMVQSGLRASTLAVVDATQMAEVRAQWARNPASAWKLTALAGITAAIPFSGKHSTPWGQGSVHDFMHAKCVVADDCTFVGSYNLSHSGEDNAENVVQIEDPGLADLFAAFVERVARRYPPLAVP